MGKHKHTFCLCIYTLNNITTKGVWGVALTWQFILIHGTLFMCFLKKKKFTCHTNLQFFCKFGRTAICDNGKIFLFLCFRFTMKRSCSMVNWTFSVTQIWWTLLWMFTEVYFLRRKFPIVSSIVHTTNSHLEKYGYSLSYRMQSWNDIEHLLCFFLC